MKKIKSLVLMLFLIAILFGLSIFAYASEIIITPPEESHTYTVTSIDSNKVTYVCDDCGEEISLTKSELAVMWNIDYVNKSPQTADVDDSTYLDLNNDGIINAKDYAILNR